jgi:hypothetical protein
MIHTRPLAAVILAGTLVVGNAACISGGPACDALPTRIELTLRADSVTPDDPAVCRGRDVSLVLTSEVDGVLHVHGYDAELPATTVTAGEIVELIFTADRSGQFPIELHTHDRPQGLSLGILTVHEP